MERIPKRLYRAQKEVLTHGRGRPEGCGPGERRRGRRCDQRRLGRGRQPPLVCRFLKAKSCTRDSFPRTAGRGPRREQVGRRRGREVLTHTGLCPSTKTRSCNGVSRTHRICKQGPRIGQELYAKPDWRGGGEGLTGEGVPAGRWAARGTPLRSQGASPLSLQDAGQRILRTGWAHGRESSGGGEGAELLLKWKFRE